MYALKYHPLLEEDLKQLNNSVRLEVFKKLQKLQESPELGKHLGNKNNMNLTGLRIVYEILDGILMVHVIAIGKREEMEVYKQAENRR